MRLICPNCDAQYEIDDHAIPRDGRDVQCSNCGHAWFQAHPDFAEDDPVEDDLPGPARPRSDVAAEEQATAPGWDDPWEGDGDAWSEAEDHAPRPDRDADEGGVAGGVAVAGAAPVAGVRRKELDSDVAAILREEAEREARARKAEQADLESQGDLGLDETPRRDRTGRKPGRFPDPFTEDDSDATAGKGRAALPDIDQINTTLSPPDNLHDDDEDPGTAAAPDDAERRGFRRGFALTLLVGAILLAIYAFSPQIADLVPALKGPLAAYGSVVDAGRVWLDQTMTSIIEKINANQ